MKERKISSFYTAFFSPFTLFYWWRIYNFHEVYQHTTYRFQRKGINWYWKRQINKVLYKTLWFLGYSILVTHLCVFEQHKICMAQWRWFDQTPLFCFHLWALTSFWVISPVNENTFTDFSFFPKQHLLINLVCTMLVLKLFCRKKKRTVVTNTKRTRSVNDYRLL